MRLVNLLVVPLEGPIVTLVLCLGRDHHTAVIYRSYYTTQQTTGRVDQKIAAAAAAGATDICINHKGEAKRTAKYTLHSTTSSFFSKA